MGIRYFSTAWQDVRQSPGWFGKLCLLALLGLIPIFGSIVLYGYLYGWAREIAWGVRNPMPQNIFANEDGKFFSRGFFAFVISLVFSLIPAVFLGMSDAISGISFLTAAGVASDSAAMIGPTLGILFVRGLLSLIAFFLSIIVQFFIWVGTMRMSIYDRLSAGFQIKTTWKMMRHDFGGILRIFGMMIVLDIIWALVVGLAVTIAILPVIFSIIPAGAGALSGSDISAGLASLGIAAIICVTLLIVIGFFGAVGAVLIKAMLIRAVGYWTSQFQVPLWRGQDDPLPFELNRPYAV